jgi:hypothetical protein
VRPTPEFATGPVSVPCCYAVAIAKKEPRHANGARPEEDDENKRHVVVGLSPFAVEVSEPGDPR